MMCHFNYLQKKWVLNLPKILVNLHFAQGFKSKVMQSGDNHYTFSSHVNYNVQCLNMYTSKHRQCHWQFWNMDMKHCSIVHLHKMWNYWHVPLIWEKKTYEDKRQKGTDIIITNKCSFSSDYQTQTKSQFTQKYDDPCKISVILQWWWRNLLWLSPQTYTKM